jgi:hypothetical protein
LDDVRVPRGVTSAYAFALVEDVVWIFDPHKSREFPDEYAYLRDQAARRRERQRARTTAIQSGTDAVPV